MYNDRSVLFSLYSVKMAATLTLCPYLISSLSSISFPQEMESKPQNNIFTIKLNQTTHDL